MSASRIQTKLRKDPVRRHVDGAKGASMLIGEDPNKFYVFAYRADQTTGEQYYLDRGYTHCIMPKEGESGVRPSRGRSTKPGEPIEWMGHVLMCIDRAKRMEIEQHGDEECGGQDWIDQVEERIVDKSLGGLDGLRGLQTRYAYVKENSITPASAVE